MIALLVDNKGFYKTQMLPGYPQPTIKIYTYAQTKSWEAMTLDPHEILTIPEITFYKYRKLLDSPVEIWEYREEP